MEQNIKKYLPYVFIGIIILIILRILYLNINDNDTNTNIDNYNLETFVIDNNNAVDLLSIKYKSTDALQFSNNKSSNIEMQIYPWSNKLYNIQNTTLQQLKPIALYKPNLIINNVQYLKLGDMVSQDTNYNPPGSQEFTLLIKQSGSDVKPPINYNLIIDSGNIDTFDPIYYKYSTFFNNINNLNNISESLTNCSNALIQLNNIIKNNMALIQAEFQNNINAGTFAIGDSNKSISQLNNPISITITKNTNLILPAGIIGKIVTVKEDSIDISIPSTINNISDKDKIISMLPLYPYNSITATDIIEYKDFALPIFEHIPTQIVINYILNLCHSIIYIYDTKNIGLISYLNLVDNVSTVNAIVNMLNNITDLNQFNVSLLQTYINNNTSTLLGIVLNIIINATLHYKLKQLKFYPYTLGINDNGNFKLNISGFADDLFTNINPNALDITSKLAVNNTLYNSIKTLLNYTIPNISNFYKFTVNLNNQNIPDYPLQIYSPIPPDNYVSLGHVFCNKSSDLDYIKSMQNVACIPLQCAKEIRDWLASDKIFEYNNNGIYWAIYLNPYTGTFISTTAAQVPPGKICKVVACVKKCTAVDDLKKADDCARKYYNINKNAISNTPIIPNLVKDQEEEFYLSKIKTQSDSIAKLSERAQKMQLTLDKANIINREMNKNKLQNYVDTQKANIDIIMNRLIKDRNKIKTDINIKNNVINNVINTIINSPNIPDEQKPILISKITKTTDNEYKKNLSQVLYSLPKYDLTDLVKKTQVADVCYGCDTP